MKTLMPSKLILKALIGTNSKSIWPATQSKVARKLSSKTNRTPKLTCKRSTIMLKTLTRTLTLLLLTISK